MDYLEEKYSRFSKKLRLRRGQVTSVTPPGQSPTRARQAELHNEMVANMNQESRF